MDALTAAFLGLLAAASGNRMMSTRDFVIFAAVLMGGLSMFVGPLLIWDWWKRRRNN
jgi:hypothetical protein